MRDNGKKTVKKEVVENDDFLESPEENKKAILIVSLSILLVLGLIGASIYFQDSEAKKDDNQNSNISSSSQIEESSKTGRDYTYDDGNYPITK